MLVLPNIYLLKKNVKGANIYVIEESDGITLIDCGFEGSDMGIIEFIESLGSSMEDIKNIVLTHGHPDHVGALPELIDVTDARVYIHENDIGLLEKFTGLSRDKINNLILLKGGENLDILEGTTVIDTPGHTDGSIVLFNPRRKILVTGDVLIVDAKGELSLPKEVYTKDLDKEKESVKKLAEYDFDTILPGHGIPIIDNAKSKYLLFIKTL